MVNEAAVQPWKTVDSIVTPEGKLDLRQRGTRSFLITIAGRVLMTSEAHRSETDLARRASAALVGATRPRVLIGGLGMGFTLRAALDAFPAGARFTVVELGGICSTMIPGAAASVSRREITS